jgi:O-antigen/teichoic acid export membrane protein
MAGIRATRSGVSASMRRRALALGDGAARQNSVGSMLIQGSQRLSRVIPLIVAAAVLPPPSFATLALALALTDIVRGALLAFDVGAVRAMAGGEDAIRVVRANLDAKTLAGSLGLLVAAVVADFVYGFDTLVLVLVSGTGMLFSSYAGTFLAREQASLALRTVSIRVVLASGISAVLALALLWVTDLALGVVLGLAIGDTVLLALVGRGHRWTRPAWHAAVALIRARARLVVMQLAYIGQFRVGTIALATVGSAVAVGEYTVASRIAEGMVMLAAALTATSLPLMGAAFASKQRLRLADVFERSYRLALAVITPSMAVLVLAAPLWIPILFPRYPESGVPFAIVGLAVVIFFASSQTTALLNATHIDTAASRSAVAGLVVSVLCSVTLLPFGAAGVASARVAGELTRLLIEAAAIVRDLDLARATLLHPWIAGSVVIAGATLAVVGSWQSPFVWIGAAAVAVGTSLMVRSPDARRVQRA